MPVHKKSYVTQDIKIITYFLINSLQDDSDNFAEQDVIVTGWGTRNASFIDLPSLLNQVP